MRQRTIGAEIVLEGVGLHSGRRAVACIRPAPSGTGIVFRALGADGGGLDIPATIDHVRDSARSTGLAKGEAAVDTVEHILAALYGCGIDNALVVCDGAEAPILDGSAGPICDRISEVGMEEQGAPARIQRLGTPVYVAHGESHAVALPSTSLHITVASEFRAPVGRSCVSLEVAGRAFAEGIARARTPGFIEEWELLKQHGLALGASQDNVLLVLEDRYGVEPRWPDEAGRHKALDLIGDLALIGGRLQAHVVTVRGGHGLNRVLVRTLQGLVTTVD